MQQKLNLVDADTLLSTPIEKNEFVVDGLIPQGVSLLCGSGKIGKSWLMLWLGICVAGGKEFLQLPTRQSEVLYLCLEDTLTRIQNRLFELVDEAPPGLRFTTVCGKLGEGPMIGFYPVLSRQITKKLTSIADEQGIKWQYDVGGGRTGTNADDIAVTAGGIPCGLLSVAIRNMHTPVETVDCDDVEKTAQLLAAYIRSGGIK